MGIFLVRHSEPSAATNPQLNAAGFAQWVRKYNASGLSDESVLPASMRNRLPDGYVVCSDLPRAIQSAQVCFDRPADEQLSLLREMEIPRYKLPFRLGAYTWLILNRALWYSGLKGKFESFEIARDRARLATDSLEHLYKVHGELIVFGHVLMNKQIAKCLIRRGWRGQVKHCAYWGMMELEPLVHY